MGGPFRFHGMLTRLTQAGSWATPLILTSSDVLMFSYLPGGNRGPIILANPEIVSVFKSAYAAYLLTSEWPIVRID